MGCEHGIIFIVYFQIISEFLRSSPVLRGRKKLFANDSSAVHQRTLYEHSDWSSDLFRTTPSFSKCLVDPVIFCTAELFSDRTDPAGCIDCAARQFSDLVWIETDGVSGEMMVRQLREFSFLRKLHNEHVTEQEEPRKLLMVDPDVCVGVVGFSSANCEMLRAKLLGPSSELEDSVGPDRRRLDVVMVGRNGLFLSLLLRGMFFSFVLPRPHVHDLQFSFFSSVSRDEVCVVESLLSRHRRTRISSSYEDQLSFQHSLRTQTIKPDLLRYSSVTTCGWGCRRISRTTRSMCCWSPRAAVGTVTASCVVC